MVFVELFGDLGDFPGCQHVGAAREQISARHGYPELVDRVGESTLGDVNEHEPSAFQPEPHGGRSPHRPASAGDQRTPLIETAPWRRECGHAAVAA